MLVLCQGQQEIRGVVRRLNLSGIVGPMQKCLPLFGSTLEVAFSAVFTKLCNVSLHCLPSFDLAPVIRTASSHIVSAVPLEPSSRVVRVEPALLEPVRQRLRSVQAEAVQLRVVELVAELRFFEPFFRKLFSAVCHIFAAENAELQHLLGGQVGLEVGVEVFPHGFGEVVSVTRLHEVIYNCSFLSHCRFRP